MGFMIIPICVTDCGECSQTCTVDSRNGSTVCTCFEGYRLQSDGKKCNGKIVFWVYNNIKTNNIEKFGYKVVLSGNRFDAGE